MTKLEEHIVTIETGGKGITQERVDAFNSKLAEVNSFLEREHGVVPPSPTGSVVFGDFTAVSPNVSVSSASGEEVITVNDLNAFAALDIGMSDNFIIEVQGNINTGVVADLGLLRNIAGAGIKVRHESRAQYTSGFISGQGDFGAQDGVAGNGSTYHDGNVWLNIKVEVNNGTAKHYVNDILVATLDVSTLDNTHTWFSLETGSWKNLTINAN